MYKAYRIPVLNDHNLAEMYRNIGRFPVRTSLISTLSSRLSVNSLAVKFVFDGEELYTINGEKHRLKTGRYILANAYSGCSVEIDSKIPSKGVCIDISYDYAEQVLAGLYAPDNLDILPQLKDYYCTAELFQHGRIASPPMQQLLQNIWKSCGEEQPVHWLDDLLKDITYHTVLDQDKLFKAYRKVDCVRASTRKELLARMQKSLDFIHDNLLRDIAVPDIAEAVNLSEFRYYHVFKQVFGTSPYKYIMKQRLYKAVDMKQQLRCSWSEVAQLTGFADLPAFSKAYRKEFGRSPSM